MDSKKWEEYTFDNLIEIIGGGTPKTTVEEYWNGDIPWLSVKDFNNDDRTVYETEKTITKLGLEKSSTKLLNKGDLIISARGTVGALAQLSEKMAFNQSCYGLKANGKVTNDFLYYLIKYKIKSIQSNTHGSVFSTITKDTFKILKSKIPIDIGEQKVISKILSDLDEKIEVNNEINKKLEEMAQAIFKQWFVDFEFPNEEGKPYKSSGGEMVESELGMIPKAWEVKKLGDLIKVIDNRGKTPPLEKGISEYPIIDVKALSGDERIINYNNCLKFVNEETYRNWFRNGHPYEGDILLSTVGSLAEMKLFYGKVGCIAQNVVALRAERNLNKYLYQYLKSIKSTLVSYNIGSVQPSIKVTHIIKHNILLPNKEVMSKYQKSMDLISETIFNNTNESKQIINIRDSLLPKLMSGEIRIK